GQNVLSEPSSRSMPDIGLNTNRLPEELPPQRMPSSVTLLPLPDQANTGEPLSPPPTPAFTKLWQSCTMLVPLTPTLTHVLVMVPKVQPVVRPILLACEPATGFACSAVMLNVPTISIEPERLPR